MRPESTHVLPALVGLTLAAAVSPRAEAQAPGPPRDPVRTTAYATPAKPPTAAMNPAPALAPSVGTTAVHPPLPVTFPKPAGLATPEGATAGRPAAPTASGYWGPAPTPVPPKKSSALRRVFQRVGTFLGADEEMGSTPVSFDKTTGRTTPGTTTKPWMK